MTEAAIFAESTSGSRGIRSCQMSGREDFKMPTAEAILSSRLHACEQGGYIGAETHNGHDCPLGHCQHEPRCCKRKCERTRDTSSTCRGCLWRCGPECPFLRRGGAA